jgi:outer membrane protein assembly factor BamB
VVSNRVYAFGSTGILSCLDLETGQAVWSTNVVGTVPAQALEWGLSSSPLVFSNLVVVAPRGIEGRSLVAYRADTGAFAWAGRSAQANYSSPRLEVLDSVPQILTFTEAAAAAHDPAGGELLWEYPWQRGHPHITDPRVIGTNLVLISSGYGAGSHLVEVRRGADGRWVATNQIWRSMALKSKFANILLQHTFAYGLDDGRLVCLDLADGSERWEGERYGHGQLLLVGEVILLTAENGDVALVEATPQAFRELSRFSALKGKTWNPPALAREILQLRNDREAAAYRLPVEQ